MKRWLFGVVVLGTIGVLVILGLWASKGRPTPGSATVTSRRPAEQEISVEARQAKQFEFCLRHSHRLRGGNPLASAKLRKGLLAQGLPEEETTREALMLGGQEHVRLRMEDIVRRRLAVARDVETGAGPGRLFTQVNSLLDEQRELLDAIEKLGWQPEMFKPSGNDSGEMRRGLARGIDGSLDEAERRLIRAIAHPQDLPLMEAEADFAQRVAALQAKRDRPVTVTEPWEIEDAWFWLTRGVREPEMVEILVELACLPVVRDRAPALLYHLFNEYSQSPRPLLEERHLRDLLSCAPPDALASAIRSQGERLLNQYRFLEGLGLADTDVRHRAIRAAAAERLILKPVDAVRVFNGQPDSKDDEVRRINMEAYASGRYVPKDVDIVRWAVDPDANLDLRLNAVRVLQRQAMDSVDPHRAKPPDLLARAAKALEALQKLVEAGDVPNSLRVAAQQALLAHGEASKKCASDQDARLRARLERQHGRHDLVTACLVLGQVGAMLREFAGRHGGALPATLASLGDGLARVPGLDSLPLLYSPVSATGKAGHEVIVLVAGRPFYVSGRGEDPQARALALVLMADGQLGELDRKRFAQALAVSNAVRQRAGEPIMGAEALGDLASWAE